MGLREISGGGKTSYNDKNNDKYRHPGVLAADHGLHGVLVVGLVRELDLGDRLKMIGYVGRVNISGDLSDTRRRSRRRVGD